MSRKRKRSLRPAFVFTRETLRLAEEAIKLFEQPLGQAGHLDPKIVFAEATVKRIQEKLATMKQSVGLMCMVSFDYNEKVLLIQALRSYSFVLLSLSGNDRQMRKIRQCQYMAAFFEAEHARTAPKRPP